MRILSSLLILTLTASNVKVTFMSLTKTSAARLLTEHWDVSNQIPDQCTVQAMPSQVDVDGPLHVLAFLLQAPNGQSKGKGRNALTCIVL